MCARLCVRALVTALAGSRYAGQFRCVHTSGNSGLATASGDWSGRFPFGFVGGPIGRACFERGGRGSRR